MPDYMVEARAPEHMDVEISTQEARYSKTSYILYRQRNVRVKDIATEIGYWCGRLDIHTSHRYQPETQTFSSCRKNYQYDLRY